MIYVSYMYIIYSAGIIMSLTNLICITDYVVECVANVGGASLVLLPWSANMDEAEEVEYSKKSPCHTFWRNSDAKRTIDAHRGRTILKRRFF